RNPSEEDSLMARRASLIVEQLEGRALLSGVSYSLTTDKSVYQVGEPIQITFTETNDTDQPISFTHGPGVDSFSVAQDDVTVWQSNRGWSVWQSNGGWWSNPPVIWLDTLQPGQSFTRTATWDGIPNAVP